MQKQAAGDNASGPDSSDGYERAARSHTLAANVRFPGSPMKKIVALALLACFTCSACEEAEPVEAGFRQVGVVAADAPTFEYVGKLLGSCFEMEREIALTLTAAPPTNDGLQAYTFTIESDAPVGEVTCLWEILDSWN